MREGWLVSPVSPSCGKFFKRGTKLDLEIFAGAVVLHTSVHLEGFGGTLPQIILNFRPSESTSGASFMHNDVHCY